MNGNLLGGAFSDYVNDQIKARQKLHGKKYNRSNQEIQYLSSRNAWIKLASGVSLDQSRLDLLSSNPLISSVIPGQDLAIKNVLFNGLTSFGGINDRKIDEFNKSFKPINDVTRDNLSTGDFKDETDIFNDFSQTHREGIRGANRAYGVGGTDFGFSPMPGITEMDFKCLNHGSIKKSTLKIKAHNSNQFDIIDTLYLRLGYSVFLEWGYDKYLDNSGNIQPMGTTLIDGEFWNGRYAKTDYSQWLPQIETMREERHGNYDGSFGIISNFSWTFLSDGTYDITLEIMGLGDIIESLKVNLPPTGEILDPRKTIKLQSVIDTAGSTELPQNRFYGTLYPELEPMIENWFKKAKNGGTGWQLRKSTQDTDTIDEEYVTGKDVRRRVLDRTYYLKQILPSDDFLEPLTSELGDAFKIETIEIQYAIQYALRSFYKQFITNRDGSKEDFNLSQPSETELINYKNYKEDSTIGERISNLFGYSRALNDKGMFDSFNTKQYDLDGNIITGGDYLPSITKQGLAGNFNEVYTNRWGENVFNFLTSYPGSTSSSKYLGEFFLGGPRNKNLTPSIAYFKKLVYEYFNKSKLVGGKLDERFANATLDAEERAEIEGNVENILSSYKNRINKFFYEIRSGAISNETRGLGNVGNAEFSFWINLPGNLKSKKNAGEIILLDPLDINIKDAIKAKWGGDTGLYYIRLGAFLQFLNNEVIPKIYSNSNNTKPLISIDTNPRTNICYVIDNVISIDPKKCIVANSYFTIGLSDPNDPSTAITQQIFYPLNDFVHDQTEGKWGDIMNIYFSFDRIEEIFGNVNEKSEVSLYKVLKTICTDINSSLGNINNLEPVVDEDQVIHLIDQTPIPNLKSIAAYLGIEDFSKSKEVTLEILGYNPSNNQSNFIRNIGITTEINKDYATMITIGATSQGAIPGFEAMAFSKWNVGIVDRFKNNITDATTTTEEKLQDSIIGIGIKQNYQIFLSEEESRFGLNDDENLSINQNFIDFNKSTVEDFYKLAQSENSNSKTLNDDGTPTEEGYIESSMGFIPFNLKLDMDGISGMKIYQKLNIQQRFLPSNYPETIEFLVTGINHKLSGNDWTTSLETIGVPKN